MGAADSGARTAGVTAARAWSRRQRRPGPFDLGVDTQSELRHLTATAPAGVVTISKHSAATPRLISSHPPRPWKGLGKAGRLPSAAAEVNTTAAGLGLPELRGSTDICSAQHSWYQYRRLWGRQRQTAEQ